MQSFFKKGEKLNIFKPFYKSVSLLLAFTFLVTNNVYPQVSISKDTLRPPLQSSQTTLKGATAAVNASEEADAPVRVAAKGVTTRVEHDFLRGWLETNKARSEDNRRRDLEGKYGVEIYSVPDMFSETGKKGHYAIRDGIVYIDREILEGENGELYLSHEVYELIEIIKYGFEHFAPRGHKYRHYTEFGSKGTSAPSKEGELMALVNWFKESKGPRFLNEREAILNRLVEWLDYKGPVYIVTKVLLDIHSQVPRLPDEDVIVDIGDVVPSWYRVIYYLVQGLHTLAKDSKVSMFADGRIKYKRDSTPITRYLSDFIARDLQDSSYHIETFLQAMKSLHPDEGWALHIGRNASKDEIERILIEAAGFSRPVRGAAGPTLASAETSEDVALADVLGLEAASVIEDIIKYRKELRRLSRQRAHDRQAGEEFGLWTWPEVKKAEEKIGEIQERMDERIEQLLKMLEARHDERIAAGKTVTAARASDTGQKIASGENVTEVIEKIDGAIRLIKEKLEGKTAALISESPDLEEMKEALSPTLTSEEIDLLNFLTGVPEIQYPEGGLSMSVGLVLSHSVAQLGLHFSNLIWSIRDRDHFSKDTESTEFKTAIAEIETKLGEIDITISEIERAIAALRGWQEQRTASIGEKLASGETIFLDNTITFRGEEVLEQGRARFLEVCREFWNIDASYKIIIAAETPDQFRQLDNLELPGKNERIFIDHLKDKALEQYNRPDQAFEDFGEFQVLYGKDILERDRALRTSLTNI